MMRLTKLDIAVEQLNHAISMFLRQEHLVSAITLACAAKEILGKLAVQSSFTPALKRRTEGARALYKLPWGADSGVKPFVDLKNKARNELKHIVAGTPIRVNLEEEAMCMLDRAVENYRCSTFDVAPRWPPMKGRALASGVSAMLHNQRMNLTIQQRCGACFFLSMMHDVRAH